jgi:tRNA-dihydrouridine synthase 3
LHQVRTAYFEGKNRIDSLIADFSSWGASAVTIHGRSRQQRYSKLADWDYVYQCTKKAPNNLQVVGNGDVFSFVDWNSHKTECPELATCMIARGALIKVSITNLAQSHLMDCYRVLYLMLVVFIGNNICRMT